MNDVARPLADELRAIAAHGYDFVDLTLEPPHAWPVDGREVGRLVRESGLQAVGHTPPFLPLASPIAELRVAARHVFRKLLDEFVAAGIDVVNLHPDPSGAVGREEATARNAAAVADLAADAADRGVRLMIENLGRNFGEPADLRPIFAVAPAVAFHLDVGHANIGDGPNRTAAFLQAFGDRLAHVHVHDNDGTADQHLPLGEGTIDWPAIVEELRHSGYDGTVTIEVHGNIEGRDGSLERWRTWWHAGPSGP